MTAFPFRIPISRATWGRRLIPDIDYLEAQRRIFIGLRRPHLWSLQRRSRTGFERNNAGELFTTFGTFHQTNDQINFGSHTGKFAHFSSLNGNRSDYGLKLLAPDVLHDRVWGLGGMARHL